MAHALPDRSPSILKVTFWADAIERAISTAAASALSVLTVGEVAPTLINAPWLAAAYAAGGAAGVDILRSLVAAGQGNPGTASLTKATRSGAAPALASRFIGRTR